MLINKNKLDKDKFNFEAVFTDIETGEEFKITDLEHFISYVEYMVDGTLKYINIDEVK